MTRNLCYACPMRNLLARVIRKALDLDSLEQWMADLDARLESDYEKEN